MIRLSRDQEWSASFSVSIGLHGKSTDIWYAPVPSVYGLEPLRCSNRYRIFTADEGAPGNLGLESKGREERRGATHHRDGRSRRRPRRRRGDAHGTHQPVGFRKPAFREPAGGTPRLGGERRP